jgi:phosphate ABC transporter phosphate-binding protein
MRLSKSRWVKLFVALPIAASLAAGGQMAIAAPGVTYIQISGAGSTWSQNALDQWRKNVAANYGMTVNYTGTGSSAGRAEFIKQTVDFAVSEIPFQSAPEDGSQPEVSPVTFAYMPIVAGGTSLMYNLKIAGKRVTNLRLSGEVITKIFTGKITNWNDAAIAADNPGLAMPDKSIVVVARSDGSGSSAQFTLWMSEKYGSLWTYGLRSQYPQFSGFKYQAGSNGVSGYVSQDYGEGAITYVEYSYALEAGFPVAKVLNDSNYYVEPTASSVAVALLSARINSDLTQNLDAVYSNSDARSYPLSSYSYMIVPTQATRVFTAQKGTTLGTFAKYMLCEGQQQAEDLGYSPLPMNLVQAGFDQVRKIPGAEGISVDLASCNNPTFKPGDSPTSNLLATNAPQPAECDKKGPNQCTTGTAGAAATETAITGSGSGGSALGSSGGASGGSSSGLGGSATGGSSGGVTSGASPFALPDDPWGGQQFLMFLVGLFVIGVVALPPLLWNRIPRGWLISRETNKSGVKRP